MHRLHGKVAVVTGASSGIGFAVASDLAVLGLTVVAISKRQNKLEELEAFVKSIRAPGCVKSVQADISKIEEVKRVFEWIEENVGAVHVVVNNAGEMFEGAVSGMELEHIHDIVSTNLTSVMAICREGVVNMKRHGVTDGQLINISSVLGHTILKNPKYSFTAYNVTKHGLDVFSQDLRSELRKDPECKIRVINVSRGSACTANFPRDVADELAATGCLLVPQDISDTVMHVLSVPQAVELTQLTIQSVNDTL